jgi:hypothetical protein
MPSPIPGPDLNEGAGPDPLIAKLIEQFRRPEPPREPYRRFGDTVASSLYGIPIETVAASLREYYLTRIRQTLARISAGSDWRPDDWMIVCPPYLFPGQTTIEGVQVRPTCPIDWAVFVTKTPEAMMATFQQFPLKPYHAFQSYHEFRPQVTPIVDPHIVKGPTNGC